jgi:hypothetical protein
MARTSAGASPLFGHVLGSGLATQAASPSHDITTRKQKSCISAGVIIYPLAGEMRKSGGVELDKVPGGGPGMPACKTSPVRPRH